MKHSRAKHIKIRKSTKPSSFRSRNDGTHSVNFKILMCLNAFFKSLLWLLKYFTGNIKVIPHIPCMISWIFHWKYWDHLFYFVSWLLDTSLEISSHSLYLVPWLLDISLEMSSHILCLVWWLFKYFTGNIKSSLTFLVWSIEYFTGNIEIISSISSHDF